MPFNRPWMSFPDQLDLLKRRGMTVTDDTAALRYLERIGYYRLSAYWYPFRVFELSQNPASGKLETASTDKFVDNTHFADAVHLYIFDKKLRLLMLDALERIEVAVRVDIAHGLGERDIFAYRDIKQFHPGFAGKKRKNSSLTAHEEWLNKYEGLVKRSKEDVIKHYRQHHRGDLPIWVAAEVWDFGAMSTLFSMMKVPDQQKIARKYGIDDFKVFSSWLRSLNYLRNLCAHHSRLWNRNIIDQPKLPAAGMVEWCDSYRGKNDLIAKPFLLFNIAGHMLWRICPSTGWHDRLKAHIKDFPTISSVRQLSVADMGMPDGWEGLLNR